MKTKYDVIMVSDDDDVYQHTRECHHKPGANVNDY